MNEVLKVIEAATAPAEVLVSSAFDFDRKQLRDLLDGAIYGRRFARYVLLRLEYLLASHAAPLNLPDEIIRGANPAAESGQCESMGHGL